ncbi:MAG: hypothetical protein K940chlam7_01523 [Chlamydiae bacterium]|nr:hypothetical protein [Chlamydiota bacterium]
MTFLNNVEKYRATGQLPPDIAETLHKFYLSYKKAVEKNQGQIESCLPVLNSFLDYIVDQIKSPFIFPFYHEKITSPFDYYQFGLNFLRPIVDMESSDLIGLDNVELISSYLDKGENVILLANHQTEPDPQAISLLLEKTNPKLAKEIIFVAGHRVVTDPLTVPFSKGISLLCIYSKNYIEHPPEKKREKVTHNQLTMKKMLKLLSEGGKCIYVAPSGGRDRPNEAGHVEVAPFDPQSVEMFWFMARHSSQPTYFFPLALATFNLFPPPESISVELGEPRLVSCSPVHIGFGSEIDMECFPGSDEPNKKECRKARADHIWGLVKDLYSKISSQG